MFEGVHERVNARLRWLGIDKVSKVLCSVSSFLLFLGKVNQHFVLSLFGGAIETEEAQQKENLSVEESKSTSADACLAVQVLQYIYSRVPINRRDSMLIQASFFEVEKDNVRDLGKL